MNKKLSILVFLVVFALLVLVACTQENNVTSEPSEPSEPSQPAEEEDFPQQPIQVIIPFGPGGNADQAARIVTDIANKHLPNNMVFTITTMPGGGSTIGVSHTALAEPDGYTIGMVTASGILAPLLQDTDYAITDFDGVKLMYEAVQALHIHKNAPYSTFDEWLEWVRENPGEFKFGVNAIDGPQRLAIEALAREEGLEVDAVVYDGEASSRAALLGEHVGGFVGNVAGAQNQIEDGTFIPLFNITTTPSRVIEGVPTLEDLGYDIGVRFLSGLVAPAGVPENRMDIIFDAIQKGYDDPETIERMETQGYTRVDLNRDEFTQVILQQYEFNSDMLKELGFDVNE